MKEPKLPFLCNPAVEVWPGFKLLDNLRLNSNLGSTEINIKVYLMP